MPKQPKIIKEVAQILREKMSEKDFLKWVIEYAGWHGWRTAHFRNSMVGGKHMTAVQGDGAGFPDLVMVRNGRLIFAELKRQGIKVTDSEQLKWISELKRCWQTSGYTVATYIWRPSDITEIERILK